jgi:hypothetical protein
MSERGREDLHVHALDGKITLEFFTKGMVMGGEEGQTVHLSCQVMEHCIGDCVAVKRRCPKRNWRNTYEHFLN